MDSSDDDHEEKIYEDSPPPSGRARDSYDENDAFTQLQVNYHTLYINQQQ